MTYDGAGSPLQRKSLGIRDLLHQPYVYLIDTFEKHVYKTAKHRHKKMKKKPILINTARGGLVKEDDLVEAIEKGYIYGAGFDGARS